MSLDEQLRAVLNEEADTRTGGVPDVQGLLRGGRARRRRRNAVWAGGGMLAAVIAAGGLYGAVQLGESIDGSAGRIAEQPEPMSLPRSDVGVPVEPGTYLVPAGNGEVAPYTVTVPDGWTVVYGDTLGKHWEEPGAIEISTVALDEIELYDDACHGPQTLGAAQSSVESLVTGLRRQASGPRVGDPVAITLGGLPAQRFEVSLPEGQSRSTCRLRGGGLQVWRSLGGDHFVLMDGDERASVYVVEVAGRLQVITAKTGEASADDRAELESIIGSIRFQE